jgi:hypothetical protein
MAEEIYRFRPVPLKQRCDHCRAAATVILDKLILCSDCFLEESKRRFGTASENPASDRISALPDTRKSA